MARVRRETGAVPRPPAELLDVGALPWQSRAGTMNWCTHHGLPVPNDAHLHDVLGRHRAALREWAVAAGVVQEKAPAFPDWAKLRAAGLVTPSPDTRDILRRDA